jgi:hypothetical protein
MPSDSLEPSIIPLGALTVARVPLVVPPVIDIGTDAGVEIASNPGAVVGVLSDIIFP